MQVDPPSLPSTIDILLQRVNLTRNIPFKFRDRLAKILNNLLYDVVHKPSDQAWQRYYLAPIVLLNSPPRAGKSKRTRWRHQWFDRRISLWEADELTSLWCLLPSPPRISSSSVTPASQRARAIDLTRQGAFSKAAQALRATPLLFSDETTRTLYDLHPRRPHPLVLPSPDPNSPPPEATEIQVLDCLQKSLNKHRGILGFSAKHLLSLFDINLEYSLLTAYKDFINTILRGCIPEEGARLLRAALLITPAKPNGTARPIGMRCLDARIAARLAIHSELNRIQNLVTPNQLGLSKGGVHTAIHAIRAALNTPFYSPNGAQDPTALFILDQKNAHNSLSRQAMLDIVEQELPSLIPIFNVLYGEDPELIYHTPSRTVTLTSEQGGLQGCPLIIAIFPIALHLAYLKAIKHYNDSHPDLPLSLSHISIQDDSAFIATLPTLNEFLPFVTDSLREVNLTSRPDKCYLFTDSFIPQSLSNLHHYPHHPTCFAQFCKSPCSPDPSQHSSILLSYISPTLDDLLNLQEFDDKQIAFTLLSQCVAVRVNHWMRTVPPSSLIPFLESHLIPPLRDTLDSLLHNPTRSKEWLQAILPIRLGGLGLPNHISISPLAFTAASLLAEDTISALDLNCPETDTSCTDHLRPLSKSSPPTPLPLSRDTLLSQRELSGLQHKQSFTQLHGLLSSQHQARLLSCSQKGSGLFLTAIPSGHNIMSPIIFSTALSYRLGCTPYPRGNCNLCHEKLSFAGFHAAHCKHFTSHRHNKIASHIARFTAACGYKTTLEAPLLSNSNVTPNHAPRPGDILIEDSHPPSRHYLDVSAVNPAASSYLQKSKSTPLATASLACSRKMTKYNKLFSSANTESPIPHKFTPLVVETYGSWDPSALKLFRKLAQRRHLSPGAATQSSSSILSRLLTTLDVALQASNAYAIIQCGFPKTAQEVQSPALA